MNANELQTVEASFLDAKNAEWQLKQPKDFITCSFDEAAKMMSKLCNVDDKFRNKIKKRETL